MTTNTATIHPALTQMFGECIDHGMPTHYRGDIAIDIATLMQQPTDKPFIWLLRECGTHIFFDRPYQLRTMFEYEKRRFYVWDGFRLHDGMNAHQALDRFDSICRSRKAVSA